MSGRHILTTTLKLEGCSFSEQRIYPGRGRVFISRDGRTHIFASGKCESLFHDKKKPAKLTWTQAWRRANRKAIANVGVGKRRHKGTVKTQKAIVGMSLDDLKRRRAEVEASHKAKKEQPPKTAAGPAEKKKPEPVSKTKAGSPQKKTSSAAKKEKPSKK